MGRNKSRYIDKADKKKLKDKSTVVSTTGHDIGRGTILKDSYSYISGKSLTARSGGKLVIDVASPAPSETCCVVA